MPPKKPSSPKKDGKKKGKKDDDKNGLEENRDPNSEAAGASVEELLNRIAALELEKNKEEEYRNYMQLERDKISSFWEISKKELEDKRAELRNRDREMEEMEERHAVEIKVYKQKVKHLLYEHQNNVAALKAEGEAALKLQSDQYQKREGEMMQDARALKQEIKEAELSHEDVIRQLKLEHAKETTKLRQEFETSAKEIQQKFEKKIKVLREDLDLKRKQEIHEIEERKNAHINELMKKHEKAFAEIKNYYIDITHNNLDLIKTLKEDVADMKKKEASNERLMYEIAQENKRLSEPLTKALKEVETLRRQLSSYEKDKTSLQQTKARLVDSEKKLKNLEWEQEILEQKFGQVQSERDDLYTRFESSIHDVQQRSGLRTLLLEKKCQVLSETLEKKEAQLGEVLTASNLDPSTLENVTNKLDDVLESKNQLIKALQYDLAKVSKAHNDLIRVYESKLTEFGVPVEELGFRPLITKTGPGPADLVVGA